MLEPMTSVRALRLLADLDELVLAARSKTSSSPSPTNFGRASE